VTDPANDLRSGQLFAGWRIERELARGGMGVLYLAHHPRLPRTDVIKVLSPLLSNDQRFRERFLREVTRMSTLSHPHLMTIHDSGEADDGTLYLVMPFISGGDLRALLKRDGRMPPARAAKIITQLGAALDAAHRVGVVHRDVKPENVLLAAVEPDDNDHAVLTDFGISREDMASNTLTATGELLLTPAYASPEQVLGQTVDARADQYALACILYELLTGEPPYRNDVQVVMLMAHVQEPIPRVGGRFGLPPAIDDVIAKGMAKSASERYANCRALAQAATAALGVTSDIYTTPVDLRETITTPAPGQPTPAPTPPPASPPPSSPPGAQRPSSPPPSSPPPVHAPGPAPQPPAYQGQPQYQQHQGQQYQGQPPQQPAYQGPPPGYQGPPGATPFYPGGAPPQGNRGKRKVWFALLAVVVVAAIIVAAVLGLSSKGGGKSNAGGPTTGGPTSSPSSTGGTQGSANFTAILARIPQSVRGSCQDITGKLPSNVKSFVQTLVECRTTVNGSAVTVQYRTLLGDANNITVYRTSHLGLGGSLNSPGDCKDFLSTNPNLHGTHGFAENVNSPPLVGGVWCENDGTLWYQQTSPAPGNLPLMTVVRLPTPNVPPQAQARYANLETVAPTS
jgi:serine/threonine-protein kinase